MYSLTLSDLTSLEGWQQKSAQRFLESLEDSRKVPFERVLFALGIRYVGDTKAKALARHFGNIDAIAMATEEEISDVPDIGPVIAHSVLGYFEDARHAMEIQRLRDAGLRFEMDAEVSGTASDALSGKIIVISGNFSISRDDMKALIERHGGKNSSAVSAKTSFLLAGSKPGPEKIKKAEQLGVAILGEESFFALLPEGERTEDKMVEGSLF